MKSISILVVGILLVTTLGFSKTTMRGREIERNIIEEFYENGQIKSKKEYKNGVLDGVVEYYFESGEMEIKNQYVDGRLNGFYKIYRMDGSLKYSFTYENGILKD